MPNVHRLDATRHAGFLAEQRRDPITRRVLVAGDEVVVCAGCGSAFAVDSWSFLGGEHDGQSETLREITQERVTLRGPRRRVPVGEASPDAVAVSRTEGGRPITILLRVLVVGVLFWLAILAIESRPGGLRALSREATRHLPTQSDTIDQPSELEREGMRLAAQVERSRVEQALVGTWSMGRGRLSVRREAREWVAVYRFPDPGPFSRGEAHQTMRGILQPDNTLRLTNIYHGKIANPRDYFSGPFDGVTVVSVSSDASVVAAKLYDGRTISLSRVPSEGRQSDTTEPVEASHGSRESAKGRELHTAPEARRMRQGVPRTDVAEADMRELVEAQRRRRRDRFGHTTGTGGVSSRPETQKRAEAEGAESREERRAKATTLERPAPRTRRAGVRPARRVPGDVSAPIVITRVAPHYPEAARKARVWGVVVVECIVDEQGNARDVRVLKTLPFGLGRAAADAVQKWRFRPAILNGEPVEVAIKVSIRFTLDSR